MREQITLTLDVEQVSIRELSPDEIEMVGGGFGLPHIDWGKIEHKASSIVHTAINNAKSHDWKNVGTDAVLAGGSDRRSGAKALSSAAWRAPTTPCIARTSASPTAS
jgi:hypothetical protein